MISGSGGATFADVRTLFMEASRNVYVPAAPQSACPPNAFFEPVGPLTLDLQLTGQRRSRACDLQGGERLNAFNAERPGSGSGGVTGSSRACRIARTTRGNGPRR